MQGRLQQSYKVARELGNNAYFDGEVLLSQMPRLAELVLDKEVNVPVRFEFGVNAYQLATIKGHYKAELQMECQRCLDPMVTTVEQDFELLIDASDEDIEAYQQDSVYSTEGYLDVFEVIEDELILALPIIVMHEDVQCNEYIQPVPAEEAVVTKDNPFAVLQTLKDTD